MLKTNQEKVVMMSVQGKVANPMKRSANHTVDHEGKAFTLPGTGGIVYNVKVGDSVYGLAGDHIEPGVSTVAHEKERSGSLNNGYNFYACTGNEARIVSALDKSIVGKKGVVIGHHGGIEHVIVDFPQNVMEKMTLKDEILIKGHGQGLKLTDYPEILLYNLDPKLLNKLKIKEKKKGKKKTLEVPVTAIIPGELMGSGVGALSVTTGDYDIMTMDKKYLKKHKLEDLRFGDFVAIVNHDNRYGRCWKEGAVTIGIIVHSDCLFSGHGPGVSTLMADVSGCISPVIDKKANIADILKIGNKRK
ncbi:MAG: DUF4438 domain-containing protein [Candidatus Muiribacterium halophilum]|uniref:DUF4438 domain-containing protein n=1 Tax=Muiribacterium halophilum TaxID=2053465 RepID=A0A2N5ZMZ6_MUIH1|nr:MAG: DUF4438 domain-containing protein [Candidatus Muirbacterium halophilum]